MKAIYFLQINNYIILIDLDDYKRVLSRKWNIKKSNKNIYVRTIFDKKCIYLHRFILNLSDRSVLVDHINHNGLDNRKSNLRECSAQQNCFNKRKYKKGSSQYKGVSFNRSKLKWRASIRKGSKSYNLGDFRLEEDAYKAYQVAARELFGEFCCF